MTGALTSAQPVGGNGCSGVGFAAAADHGNTSAAASSPSWHASRRHCSGSAYLVSGAALKNVNGVYTQNGESDGVPKYTYSAMGGIQYCLLRKSTAGGRYWYLAESAVQLSQPAVGGHSRAAEASASTSPQRAAGGTASGATTGSGSNCGAMNGAAAGDSTCSVPDAAAATRAALAGGRCFFCIRSNAGTPPLEVASKRLRANQTPHLNTWRGSSALAG